MAISFSFIPAALRVPGAYAEFDNSQALRGVLPSVAQRVLILGQKLPTGTAPAETAIQVLRSQQAAEFFGRGSMLHRMFERFEANNGFQDTYAIALDDAAAGVEATGQIAITGTATGAGTLNVYIGGRRVRVAVAVGDAAADVASALAAAIAADLDLAVTGAATLGDVDLTAKHKGEAGNFIDLRTNYFGEAVPAGITVAFTAMAGGTGNPDIGDALAVIGDEHYNYIACPWTDGANLTTLVTYLEENWQPIPQKESQAFLGYSGTVAELSTFGDTQNSPLLSTFGMFRCPMPPEEVAAAYCGQAGLALETDPARPLNTLPLVGILPPAREDRFTFQEENVLLYSGITPPRITTDGDVLIMRAITMFQVDEFGFDDISYLDVTTISILARVRLDWRASMLRFYPRHKLADDGTPVDAGQAIATPRQIAASTVGRARLWANQGWIEGLEQFEENLVVTRSESDPTRVDLVMPPNLINGLQIFAAKIQFLL